MALPDSPREDRRATVPLDLSVLLVAVIWGSSYVVMQDVGESVSAASFLALRFMTALPVIVLIAARTLPHISRSEVVSGAFFGSLLYGILILETVGVKHTSAANSGFLITVSVVLIPVLERVISRRRQAAMVYAATVTALVGCGLLVLEGGLHPQSGDLIILGAALVRATQITLFGRQSGVTGKQSLSNLTLVEFLVVCLLASITSAFTSTPVWEASGAVSGQNWLLIAYLGVLGTSYAFFVQLRAARLSSSTRVGLILATEPLFAAVFAVLAAGEGIGLIQGIGGALIVLAAIVGRHFEGRNKAEPVEQDTGASAEQSTEVATSGRYTS
ncbi:drug/metabolite transporter (DMT)-like permease [Streptomyces umbrinus]|uniref:Drug/metabolite transporter (DMT)-like permease n=1 Tax=Streptomyces umbrinus TaxID=67370 RepID=A0ABU0T0Y0_9ACTN|nr:DMT family transporter [Streptomyces umbrinus]MDQ1029475.1 drug/metabolite transporter (DMT)-like permease [Streptomyces umbrinus]